MTKEDYNNVAVVYCKDCLSLKVMDQEGYAICGNCGGENIGEEPIEN